MCRQGAPGGICRVTFGACVRCAEVGRGSADVDGPRSREPRYRWSAIRRFCALRDPRAAAATLSVRRKLTAIAPRPTRQDAEGFLPQKAIRPDLWPDRIGPARSLFLF
jgi:hypothetical protein